MARDGFGGIVVWLRKLSGYPQARKGSEGHRDLVRPQIRAGQAPPCGGRRLTRQLSAETQELMEAGGNPPKAHVGLDQHEVADKAGVRRPGSGLEHVPSILGME